VKTAWISAIRPKTLVASILPVCLSISSFDPSIIGNILIPGLLCLLFALLVQVGTNLANDYYDAKKGTDYFRSNAPTRMVSEGFLSPQSVLRASFYILSAAFLVGFLTVLISDATRWFLPFGLLCIFLAYAYTGGSFPIAYNGLGDVFVVLFFGFGAVEGTSILLSYAANTSWVPQWFVSFGMGLTTNNLLVVNNYRDYQGDKKAKKRTTVVIFGKGFGLVLYFFSLVCSSIIFPVFTEVPLLCMTAFIPGMYGLIRLYLATNEKDFSLCLKLSVISVVAYALSVIISNQLLICSIS
jgi:1,4-dihydroxy-2-naphthoate octaprenyltransferase